MKRYILFPVIWLLPLIAMVQNFTSSNLPIIIINIDKDPSTGLPLPIPDKTKVLGTMKIIYHPDGSRNSLSDENNPVFLNYNGRIGIELRGSTSQTLPKKPFAITTLQSDNVTNNNVSLLGMPEENDWVLNSLPFDPSLIRNYLSYNLAAGMGNYCTRSKYCEIVINGNYAGLYLLLEKIKIDENRVNIAKISSTDISADDLTGGYLVKADKISSDESVNWYMPSYVTKTAFEYVNPKPSEITAEQGIYIVNIFNSLQTTVTAQNSSAVNGYPSIIDIPSFVDFMLINELASNVDAYQYSTFFHKDKLGKLRAGPIWDFDLTFGNDFLTPGFDRSKTNVWQFDNGSNTGPKFWKDLYSNPTFKCYLSKRWAEVQSANGPLNKNIIFNKIDEAVSLITEAAVRENAKWGRVPDIQKSVSNLKNWIEERIEWLNSNLSDYQECANITLPPLVISKINYQPLSSNGYNSNDLEFIEITNNSSETVDLTGVYFRELGISYQFPSNSSLKANETLYLASNPQAFQEVYGFSPFGQFARNLSNKSEKLVLADAFGNVIDYVEYQDDDPWPAQADGKGSFLQLSDLNADNNLASNWVASQQFDDYHSEVSVNIFPNPAQNQIFLHSETMDINSYEIYDLRGRKILMETAIDSPSYEINISHLDPEIYLLKVFFNNGQSKILKFYKIPNTQL